MKKYKIILTLVLVLSVMAPVNVFAYEIPADSYYVNVETSELGEIVLYFPYNMARYLSFNERTGHIINTYSSQITAYGYNGAWYYVRFPTFDVPNYKRDGITSTYTDLTITGINETNITFLNDTDFTAFSSGTLANLTMLLIGGCILLCLFMRR